MNSSKKICNHKKAEEQYICLEESCLQNSIQKIKKQIFNVDCLKCLQLAHPHHECLIHCETILQDAQQTQKTFLDLFEENQKFCSTLKQKLELNIGEIKQRYSEWIDMQYKLSLEQIEQYELVLINPAYSQNIILTLPLINLKQLLNLVYLIMNYTRKRIQKFKKFQNKINQNLFNILSFYMKGVSKIMNIKLHKINNYQKYKHVKVQTDQKQFYLFGCISKAKEYEKCTEIGCKNKKKKYFCLDQSCLQEHSTFECPTCQGMRHCSKDMQTHRQYFISANDLWEQQNKRIEELEQFCDNQGKNIKKESLELQETIMNLILNNELMLKKIKQFCQNKENEMKDKLIKFKSLYKKDELTVYKELFLQKDVSMIAADIVQCSENFQKISNNFTLNNKFQSSFFYHNCKKQCQTEKEHYQQDIKDLEDQWSKGLYQIESEKQDSQDSNQVSQYIEKLNEQILDLTQQNKQYQQQIQQNIKYKNKGRNEQYLERTQQRTIITIIIDFFNLFIILITIINQNKESQQQIYNNLDQSMKQQIEISGKLESGIQQIISSAATDKGINQTLQKEVDQLNVKLTDCINNETTKIKDLLSNIPLIISQQQYTLLTSQFKEVLKRKFSNHSKQVKYFELIYSGKRDGLIQSVYQSKVSGKSSLIIVFRSINDGQYVFGGYYPGQWNFNGAHQPDNTGISFIFSQTHNQIYPIKVKTQAIYLNSGYIVYMGSADLYVAADFVSGNSNLGSHYSTEQYQIQTNHLYGGPTPNVIECEVYQIIFQ